MGIAGVLILIVLGLATIGRFWLGDLSSTATTLEGKRQMLIPQFTRYGRDKYKLEHLKQWTSAHVDWTAHLAYIIELTPPPEKLVLDGVAGSMRFSGVDFDRRKKTFSAPMEIRIVPEGEAADRATADTFRGALVATEVYEITTTGPDTSGGKRLPYAFTYHLRTTMPAPPEASPADDQAVAARSGPRAGP